jgi:hypothetical protein
VYSSDGAKWTAVTGGTSTTDPGASTFATSEIKGIAYGGDRFVAVGGNGKIAYSN